MTEPLFRATSHIPGGGCTRKPVTVTALPGPRRRVKITVGDVTLILREGQAPRLADALVDAYEENPRVR